MNILLFSRIILLNPNLLAPIFNIILGAVILFLLIYFRSHHKWYNLFLALAAAETAQWIYLYFSVTLKTQKGLLEYLLDAAAFTAGALLINRLTIKIGISANTDYKFRILKKTCFIIFNMFSFAVIILFACFNSYYYYSLCFKENVSERITKNIIMLNDMRTSVYLIKTDSGYIAIDAGQNINLIEKGLYYNNINPDEIKAVLLTHSDFDHQNALDLYKNAKVYISKAEDEMVKNKITRFRFLPFVSNSLKAENPMLLNDGDIFYLRGIKIKCIGLPGHTLGSMGYLINDIYLFTGDALRIKNGKISSPSFNKLYAMDLYLLEQSLRKLAAYKGIEYVFTANSGFTADFDFAVSQNNK